ncbi:hypothetical protein [Neisseria montereyensis]|uniref:Lipoprotein n=1 Tax=Neisseria montereyensis TaxID=2973938 RepID=A0ABT2FED8_9NEIS|nr:hypothetical protein [Neisseria montereyensis]MCS4534320.1 hypothetical protein [Neisseria montereyensis]
MGKLYPLLAVLLLAACASQPGSGGTEVYGEIKGGVETSHISVGR